MTVWNRVLALGTGAFVLAILLGAPVALRVLAADAPRAGKPALVVAAPGVDLAAIVSVSGGRLLGPEGAPMAVLAVFDTPGFQDRLRARGVLGVFDGSFLSKLCGVEAG